MYVLVFILQLKTYYCHQASKIAVLLFWACSLGSHYKYYLEKLILPYHSYCSIHSNICSNCSEHEIKASIFWEFQIG